jgi:hypothetical protein
MCKNIKMDLVLSETNKGKKALLHEGFTYRIDFVLKSEDISWRCTKRGCKAKLRTDKDIKMVISGKCKNVFQNTLGIKNNKFI